MAAVLVAVLLAFADRYGWHRDELYFVVCGRHLAWGFIDQPPLVPAIARVADLIAPGNLVVLRVAPALTVGVDVLLIAALTREIGGARRAQLLAALFTATSAVTIGVGHLLSTEDLDVTVGLLLTWLVVRAVRTSDSWWLGLAATVSGVALLNKYLVALPVIGLLVALLVTGRIRLLVSRWVLLGALAGAILAAPNLIWQATHSWPQLTMVSSLSQGNGTYGSKPQVVVLQFALTAPVYVPSLIAGAMALWRRPALRPYRLILVSWAVVFLVDLLAGGKAYYDAPELLALLAPAAIVTADWLERGRHRVRFGLLAAAMTLAAAVATMLFLPVWPTDHVPAAVESVNQDIDGTIGWPSFARQVATAYRAVPPSAPGVPAPALLTSDYSEAGALALYGPALHLPQAYSGHNSMADFGRPPDGTQTVLAVGWFSKDQLQQWFSSVVPDGQIAFPGVHSGTDEAGAPLFLCTGPRAAWPVLWSQIRYIG